MIEQRPFAAAVGTARQEHFEGIVSRNADAPAAIVAEKRLQFRDPLRMCCAAEAETVGKQARPVFPVAKIFAAGETFAPQILCAFLAVRVMGVPPEPGGERFLF